ncbi:permease [Sneathiella aquimaris]|uniref:permease n=1 Tax=Sneathiella aquimaris TaxID=2599305 RepID=UPI00146B6873|nr:permease [Sneathiella aquimaris]
MTFSSLPTEPQFRFPVLLSKYIRKLDFPLSVGFLILAGLAFIQQDQAVKSINFTLDALIGILPFLLLSVGLAAGLKATGADQIVARVFEGRPLQAIAMASLFGALSPFCSCGVIPIVAGLLAAGVPIAPVLAFCIASPIMDPQMFVLTAASLGMEFTIVKTVAAVGMGLMTGYTTLLISRSGALENALKPMAQPSCGSSACGAPSTSEAQIKWAFWQEKPRNLLFVQEAGKSAWFLGRWLAFAFLLESLMIAFLPGEMIATWLGDSSFFALPAAVILGVPAYLNGFAAIPLIRGLIDLGMSPATGLTFMLAGSVTSIPAAVAVWSLAKPKLFALYLFFAASGSFLSGLFYMLWLS